MTGLAFIAVLILAWLHWATLGYFVTDGLTIYVAAFITTLAFAVLAAFRSGASAHIWAAVFLVASFAGNHYAWLTSDPTLVSGLVDLATAAVFILCFTDRGLMAIGGVFLISFTVSLLTALGVVPDFTQRADVYIDWSQPDLTSICGHIANVILGASAGDGGKRIRDTLAVHLRNRAMGHSVRSGVIAVFRAVAAMQKAQD
jgi:hypothetical protein